MLQGGQNLVHPVLHEWLPAGRPLEELVTVLLPGPLRRQQGAMHDAAESGWNPAAGIMPSSSN